MDRSPLHIARWVVWLSLAVMAGLVANTVTLYLMVRDLRGEMSQADEAILKQARETRRGLKRAESHILNLYKASESPLSAAPVASPHWRHVTATDQPTEFLVTTDAPTGGSIALRNIGSTRIQDVDMTVGGRYWFRSADTAQKVAAAGANQREKAFLLWQYVCDRTYMWMPPDNNGPESYNPVKTLAVYGYGWSGELSNTLVQAAKAVGIQARIRTLRGHNVPELFFNNGWRVLDPTYEVFYPDPDDNGELAGVDDCMRNPALVERVFHPTGQERTQAADVYQMEDARESRAQSFTTPPIRFRLAPAEEVVLSWYPIHNLRVDREQRAMDFSLRPWEDTPGTMAWHASAYAARPPYIGKAAYSGDYLSSRVAAKALLLDNAVLCETAAPNGRDGTAAPVTRLMISPERGNAVSTATLMLSVPFVITDARVMGTFLPSAAGDTCRVKVVADDDVLADRTFTAVEGSRPEPFSVGIGSALSGRNRLARYGYSATLEMRVKDPARGGVYGLRAETQCQITPFMPWRLLAGENKVAVRTVGDDTKCDVVFSWGESLTAQRLREAPPNVKMARSPAGDTVFTWDAPPTSDNRPPDFYEVNLSERPDFAWPAVPGGFMELTADTSAWQAPSPFPAHPGAGYFRVRATNIFGHPSPWSEPLKFTVP